MEILSSITYGTTEPQRVIHNMALLKEKALQPTTGKVRSGDMTIPKDAKGTGEVVIVLDQTEQAKMTRSNPIWFHIYELVNAKWELIVGGAITGVNQDPDVADGLPRWFFDAAKYADKTIKVDISDPKGRQVGYEVNLI